MEQIHQLMVRRRINDGYNGIWLGYDEFEGHKPTGRIVMGWHVDKATGEIVNHYAKEPPELNKAQRQKQKAPKITQAEVEAVHTDIVERMIEFADKLEEFVLDAPIEISEPITEPFIMPGAIERFVVTFDWHYGSERMVLDSFEEIAPWRKAVEAKFGHLNPTNWKITKELVISEDVPWQE